MQRPNLYDYLKILAIITMVIDHVGFLFFPEQEVRRIVGRTAFPLFLFLVGYNHSYRWKSPLRIWGVVLQIMLRIGWYYGLTDMWYLNILLAIGGTRVAMKLLQKYNSIITEAFIFVLCIGLSRFTFEYIDYGTLSVVFALVGYWTRKYGNTGYVKAIIVVSVGFHLLFMFFFESLEGYGLWLGYIGLILFLAMYLMSKRNYSLTTAFKIYDKCILALSKYALEIYVLQAFVLGSIYILV